MKKISYIFFFALIYSCANMSPPTGGDRDVQEPQIVSTKPAKETNNFNSKKIEIIFDEFFSFSNSESAVIITPTMQEKPKFLLNGKKLIIKLPDDLEENTTYNINFVDAVSDFTEGNTLDYFNYVFSTGPYIDSSSISGQLKLAANNSKPQDVYVGLYLPEDTGIFISAKPKYISKSDENGRFIIQYIKNGMYKIAALKDENGNLLYDGGNELLSLPTNPISINGNQVLEQNIYIFQNDEPAKVEAYNILPNNTLAFVFNKPIHTLSLDFDSYNSNDAYYLNNSYDTLFYHFVDSINTTTVFYFTLDSLYKDTVGIDLSNRVYNQTIKLINNTIPENKPVLIEFPYPIKEIDTSKILVQDSTGSINYNYNYNKNKIYLDADFKDEQYYTIIIDSASITYHNGTINETYKSFAVLASEAVDYGDILLTINHETIPNAILELRKQQGQLVKRLPLNDQKSVTLKDLKEGEYSLKIFIDRNNNERWDTGSFYESREPEKIIFIKENISVKDNWDTDLLINF